ncbi:MAG: flagellar protein G [Candidatus Thermoplasmatota archaeon]|nr:flagellar protein G [Candidatus Thermoplasmatota archaeon]
MGMSTSSTQLVFFIAAMVIASGLVGLFAETVTSMSDGVNSRGDMVYDQLMADITIINDPYNIPNNPVLIYVKNTGRVKIASTVDALVDNEPKISGVNLTVLEGGDWDPGKILKIDVDVNLAAGEHTVKVIIENGQSDRITFRL